MDTDAHGCQRHANREAFTCRVKVAPFFVLFALAAIQLPNSGSGPLYSLWSNELIPHIDCVADGRCATDTRSESNLRRNTKRRVPSSPDSLRYSSAQTDPRRSLNASLIRPLPTKFNNTELYQRSGNSLTSRCFSDKHSLVHLVIHNRVVYDQKSFSLKNGSPRDSGGSVCGIPAVKSRGFRRAYDAARSVCW